MEEQSTQQEVLIMTGTSFSTRQIIDKDDNNSQLSENEKLEEACWNGMLPNMLPEIFTKTDAEPAIYLWKVREASAFIELELSDAPADIEAYYSLDPLAYVGSRNYN
jgi:hypothetical protein